MRFKGFTLITIDLVQPVFHVPAGTVWRMSMELYFKKHWTISETDGIPI